MSKQKLMYDHGATKAQDPSLDVYLSPYWVTARLPMILGPDFHDPCPGPRLGHTGSHSAKPYPQVNGLESNWGAMNFVNPPFSEMEAWIDKAEAETARAGCLSLFFCKLDYRTVWGSRLVHNSIWHVPVMGYVKFLTPYKTLEVEQPDGICVKHRILTDELSEMPSATFQMCFACFGNKDQALALRSDVRYNYAFRLAPNGR